MVGLAKEQNAKNRRDLYEYIEQKYDEWEPYSVSEYRNNDTALCAERAAIAQNMLTFLGADTYYIMGHLSRNDGIENMNHAYNVVVDKEFGSGIIVDFTNPVLTESINEKYVYHSNIMNKNSVQDFIAGEYQEEITRPEYFKKDDKEFRKTMYCKYSLNELSKEDIEELFSKKSVIEEVGQKLDKENQKLNKNSIRSGYIESKIDGNEVQKAQQNLKKEISERTEMKEIKDEENSR